MRYVIGFFILAIMALTVITGIYVVDQRQYAIVFAMGEVKDVIEEPGLHFKLPTPLQNVVFLDKRIISTEAHAPDKITTAEKMNVLVDSCVRWRVADPKLFFVNFGANEQKAQDTMVQLAKAALNDEIAKWTVSDVIAGDRNQLISAIKGKMADKAGQTGVEIMDVLIRKVDYDDQVNNAVIERMRSERVRIANESRSTGEAESEKIKADADRQRTIILAEAFRDAQKIKGEGDAKASQIYANAFGKDPEFYRFYRSLEAYKESFRNKKDILVVDPSSDFFRYMKHAKSTH